jgi:transcriptional regulator with PAS, ATPase and Fis domain
MERDHVERALRAADGHRAKAAKILGISERNLYRKLREYGLLS